MCLNYERRVRFYKTLNMILCVPGPNLALNSNFCSANAHYVTHMQNVFFIIKTQRFLSLFIHHLHLLHLPICQLWYCHILCCSCNKFNPAPQWWQLKLILPSTVPSYHSILAESIKFTEFANLFCILSLEICPKNYVEKKSFLRQAELGPHKINRTSGKINLFQLH